MKLRILLLVFAATLLPARAAVIVPGVLFTNVTLAWSYPSNELSTNMVFKLYSTTNTALPMTSWPLVKMIPGPNLTTTFPMQAELRFFVMTASNFWGESTFSPVAATPPAPRFDVPLSIAPGP
jgi:hypothetical protein